MLYRISKVVAIILSLNTSSAVGTPFAVLTSESANSDQPQPADFDGDNKMDIAVFRPSDGNWYMLSSSTGAFSAVPFGSPADVGVPSAYNP
jgi:hypothetical protein